MLKRILLSLTVLGSLSSFAAEKVLINQNFDEEVVGRNPQNWVKIWGDQGKDTVLVSGDKSASGDNSLLIDHQSQTPMYGYALKLSETPVSSGILTISFKIMLTAGSQVNFEVRDNHPRDSVARWGFGESVFAISACKPNPEVWSKRVIDTRNNEWYSVKAEIPVGADKGNLVKYTITDSKGNSAATDFEYFRQPNPLQYLLFNLPPAGSPSAKTYIDDLTVTLKD